MRKMRANPFMRLANRIMTSRARSHGGHVSGMDVLVLNTLGRKSGQPRHALVARFSDGTSANEGPWLIVASAGGADLNPDWYHNLKAHPESVTIEIADSGPLPVTPDFLEGAEREKAWNHITTAMPRFTKYETKTDRVIPVIRLARAG